MITDNFTPFVTTFFCAFINPYCKTLAWKYKTQCDITIINNKCNHPKFEDGN